MRASTAAFFSEECNTALQLIHSVYLVFDTDPSVKMHPFQLGKNSIIIIQPFANLTVAQPALHILPHRLLLYAGSQWCLL